MNQGGGGQGITSQYPYYIPPEDELPEDDTVEDSTIPVDPIRFASTPSPHDFSSQYFYGAEGGRIPAAYGGIMDTYTGRRKYGLGSIFKSITKPLKKLTKSKAGKIGLAALLSKFGPAGLEKIGIGGGDWASLGTSMMDKPLPWIAGASALGGLYTGMTDEDDEEPDWLKKWRASKAAADEQFAGISDPSNLQSIRFADGGRTVYKEGGKELSHREAALRAMYGIRSNAQEGGLMDMGGMEKDYRQEGGFVPIGGQERADDVPARLSKNEFVFTADAVRAAGGGDIDAGAEVMENVMENLEQGGQVSEESQGLEGARDMFATAQRLEGVI